ncbi:MAG: hypothetical protein QNJ48_07930 [Desulfobacterales bacterium]|nr:hypothetical protein [Desulfobacterales bacterium]MDJ0884075.1 hypothetical protein [Desulfobacterales bacterium]
MEIGLATSGGRRPASELSNHYASLPIFDRKELKIDMISEGCVAGSFLRSSRGLNRGGEKDIPNWNG